MNIAMRFNGSYTDLAIANRICYNLIRFCCYCYCDVTLLEGNVKGGPLLILFIDLYVFSYRPVLKIHF